MTFEIKAHAAVFHFHICKNKIQKLRVLCYYEQLMSRPLAPRRVVWFRISLSPCYTSVKRTLSKKLGVLN